MAMFCRVLHAFEVEKEWSYIFRYEQIWYRMIDLLFIHFASHSFCCLGNWAVALFVVYVMYVADLVP